MNSKNCIACEALKLKRKSKAHHFVKKDNVEWGFCNRHYEEYLAEEEYSFTQTELEYGNYSSENIND